MPGTRYPIKREVSVSDDDQSRDFLINKFVEGLNLNIVKQTDGNGIETIELKTVDGLVINTVEQVASIIEISTTSPTFEDMTGVTVSVPVGLGGSYFCLFNGTAEFTQGNREGSVIVNVDGVDDLDTLRTFQSAGANNSFSVGTGKNLSGLVDNDIIKMRFRTTGGTLKILNHSFLILRTAGV